jgi:hypothetical protein
LSLELNEKEGVTYRRHGGQRGYQLRRDSHQVEHWTGKLSKNIKIIQVRNIQIGTSIHRAGKSNTSTLATAQLEMLISSNPNQNTRYYTVMPEKQTAIRWHNERENASYPFRQLLSDRRWATTPGLAQEHTLPTYQTTIKTNYV